MRPILRRDWYLTLPSMIQEALEASLLLDGTGIDQSKFAIGPQLLAKAAPRTPPTYVVHGSIDDKVTPRNGHDVHVALDKLGVDNVWDLREGLDHLFGVCLAMTFVMLIWARLRCGGRHGAAMALRVRSDLQVAIARPAFASRAGRVPSAPVLFTCAPGPAESCGGRRARRQARCAF